ncbi:MAG: alanine--tRNA ligase [Parcubacteria group bacterium CG10_big_fil_rev_8_21_14_0_10_38_31]|nr:MAG: alanine--tRNA ligase [Parcubacteria group bacterium CG10_big_fil_rev_8_21_14_0_10_38_31]
MKPNEVRQKFLTFFESKGHKIMPSSSLVSDDDSSVLFTTAGMQQFKPYYLGKKNATEDFGSLSTTSSQKCIRTSDIEEVGDASHLTFFEMLGNFSFGGYFKEEAIKYAYEFIVGELGLDIDYVTVFMGDKNVPFDNESYDIWKNFVPEEKIKKFGKEDNFWGPTGKEGPCGPTTEIYVKGVEVWNIVFNEYYCRPKSDQPGADSDEQVLENLPTSGVDTGMGLERLSMMVSKTPTIFETDLFGNIIKEIEKVSGVSYFESGYEKVFRIIADHIRSSVFILSDGVAPSNSERGYILRRLIRRLVRHMKILNIESSFMLKVAKIVIESYKDAYPDLVKKEDEIISELKAEEERFEKTLKEGLKQFEKFSIHGISGHDAFILFSTYGFPFEETLEVAREKGIKVDEAGFREEFKRHQEVSRAGMEKKFKGGLSGTSPEETRLHTATHLLHQALREVLGLHVAQKGSNITPERLRFDFSHSEKMTPEELKKVEDIVNERINEKLSVTVEDMTPDEAKEKGAIGIFGDKYEDKVKVYSVSGFSKEICGGPHVQNTSELGHFKIKKEEATSAGVRRIKAVLE